jgi:hypothetical protein
VTGAHPHGPEDLAPLRPGVEDRFVDERRREERPAAHTRRSHSPAETHAEASVHDEAPLGCGGRIGTVWGRTGAVIAASGILEQDGVTE